MGADRLTFEAIALGVVAEAGPMRVTREAVTTFARAFDPQPFHLDEAAGTASPLGGLAASGWHTGAMGMRLIYDGFVSRIASLGSPGITELKWLKPVRPGDDLSARIEVLAARASKSRPDMGLLTILLVLRRADGTPVLEQRFPLIVARHATEPAITRPDNLQTPTADDLGRRLGAETFMADAIVQFAELFDPQPFHLDAAAGRASHFGGLVASGWHVAACWMKHAVAHAAAAPTYAGRISPGFRDLHWYAPVRPGDTITFWSREVKRRPVSREGWELVSSANAGTDASGRVVFAFAGTTLQPRVTAA